MVSQHALQVVSQHALQQVSSGGGGIPAYLAGFQAHAQGEVEGDLARGVSKPTPKGEVEWNLAGGGSPGPHPRGKLRGIWPGRVSRPTPKGEVEGDLAGGGSPGPHPRGKLRGYGQGVSRPTPKGKLRGIWPGGSPGHTWGGLSQHALRQTPPPRWLLLRTVRILLECSLAKTHVCSTFILTFGFAECRQTTTL